MLLDFSTLPWLAGVYASTDGAEVATPVSLVEWFLNFYEATQEGDVRPVEGIVRAGEVLFVPRGWWHLAMNLEVFFVFNCHTMIEQVLCSTSTICHDLLIAAS